MHAMHIWCNFGLAPCMNLVVVCELSFKEGVGNLLHGLGGGGGATYFYVVYNFASFVNSANHC